MKVAVVGASGLIGAHVVRCCLDRGHQALAIVRTAPVPALAGVDVPCRFADVLGPIEALVSAFEGVDVVIHCAANFAYGGDGDAIQQVATLGTENVLNAAHLARVRRVVVTSSSVVFGYSTDGEIIDESAGLADPEGQPAYVIAKIAQDRLALALAERLDLELVLACPTMSVGGHAQKLGPSNAIITAYLADPTRTSFTGGCNIVAARDVGLGHALLAEHGQPGIHYLLGGENLLWTDIHALIGVLAGVGGPWITLGANSATLVARISEAWSILTGKPSGASSEQASMLGRYYWYRHDRATAIGYEPAPAAATLLDAVSWLAASAHVSREVRATMRLADAVQRHRYAEAAA